MSWIDFQKYFVERFRRDRALQLLLLRRRIYGRPVTVNRARKLGQPRHRRRVYEAVAALFCNTQNFQKKHLETIIAGSKSLYFCIRFRSEFFDRLSTKACHVEHLECC
jgi:hypothetical protein